MHSKIHLFRQSMYNRRHCYPYESINSAQQKPEKCNSIRCSLAPPGHPGSLRTSFLSVHQIIKTPQEFVHYSSWLERAFWRGKHTAIFQKTFSSIKLPSPITQKSWWFQENVMMRPFPLTFVADSSVATGSTSSKIKCCDQSFVVKCVATLLFYCLSLCSSSPVLC